jgi:alkanesulfonate monooxygenase SsuD/methylene tetrahydromethanopterin reductase-like flavin-dependent oxidoreductase (luciferase family)
VTPPYTAARRLAALDHASAGRMGWFLDGATHAARAADYLVAVLALWDSWNADLHRIDRAAGRYIDTAGIRAADHRGPFYASAGPLDIPRPPQGHPVFYAAQAAPGVDMLLSRDLAGAAPASAATGPHTPTDTPATLRAQLGLPPVPSPAHAHAR